MKKTLVLTVALVATAITSQAVTFRWSTNVIQAPGVGSGNIGSGNPVKLINLGLGGSFSYAAFFANSFDVVDTRNTLGGASAGKVNLQTANLGMISGGDPNPSGNVYAAVIGYTFGELTYYNASSIFTLPSVENDIASVPDTTFTFSSYAKNDLKATWGDSTADYLTLAEAQAALYGTASAGSGWYSFTFIPVPEPATAGLAFAGLALLFRRKRK